MRAGSRYERTRAEFGCRIQAINPETAGSCGSQAAKIPARHLESLPRGYSLKPGISHSGERWQIPFRNLNSALLLAPTTLRSTQTTP